MTMHDKTILITGASRGLGFEMAKRFQTECKQLIITGRNESTLKEAATQLGQNVDYCCVDMEDMASIEAFVKTIAQKYTKVDVLINNAGTHQKKEFLDVSQEDFERVVKVNQEAVFVLSKEVSKLMKKQGGGVILNISSMASIYGIPKVIAYTASKSAIEGMTRAMAVELAQYGIRVNCVAPGFIKTAMSSKALDNDPKRKAKVLGRTPLARLGKPKDIAEAAFFLCSDKAEYITGVVLPVDGGNSISF